MLGCSAFPPTQCSLLLHSSVLTKELHAGCCAKFWKYFLNSFLDPFCLNINKVFLQNKLTCCVVPQSLPSAAECCAVLEPLKHRNGHFMQVCVAGKLQRGRSALEHLVHPQGWMGKAGGVHTSGVVGLGEAE